MTTLTSIHTTTPTLRPEFDRLAEDLLQAASGRRVVFLQNAGNVGDALIRHGTLRFFEDIGLSFSQYDMGWRADKIRLALDALANRAAGDTLFVYSGSGAWAKASMVGQRNVARLARVAKNVFVLPSTFEVFGVDSRVRAWVRDREESRRLLPDRPFCHDMAFYLALIDEQRMLVDRCPAPHGTGNMFRTDSESAGAGFADLPGNVDISAAGDHRTEPEIFLRHIDRYEHIATDRLHVAIGAALLGKVVTLFTGSYFKIRAIYNSSIAPYFPRVTYLEDAAAVKERLGVR